MATNAFLKALFYILFLTLLLPSEGTMNRVARTHTVCFREKFKYCDNDEFRCDTFCIAKGFGLGGHCSGKACCCPERIPPA
ncbi:hypothetical protein HN51_048642 [Arachis hypogaea]|nr:uncharacterized protein DS421_12g379300 [Arachis hypogaea]